MKKAQTETMGLMVVVVLLFVIALIALRFFINSSPTSNLDTTLSIKANNLANGIINANVCNGDFKQAIVSCCNHEDLCNENACNLVTDELNKVINYSDESAYVEAIDQTNSKCFSVGSCQAGVSSAPYNLDNGVTLNVRLCPKQ